MYVIRTVFFLLAVSAFLLMAQSCVKERFIRDDGAGVNFGLDTLRFDTVFTRVGSATRQFKVYNPHSLPIILDRIELAAGDQSRFRFNIDGLLGPVAEDVEIGANDSIYVFVEVTVDPDQPLSVSPFVIEEQLLFRVNGLEQKVYLEAWGQNANYIPSRFGKNGVALLSCDFNQIVWNDPKPYVIYGILVVDECTLVWPEGTRVYVHGGIGRGADTSGTTFFYNDGLIFVGAGGRIISNGSIADPVTVRGDRLEPFFDDIPGQWQGIRLDKGSSGNRFSHTTIRNSLYGIFVDSTASAELEACQIFHTTTDGILAFNGTIRADNCLFYENGRNSFSAILGGDYAFSYCTFANYGNDQPAVGISGGYCYDFPVCQTYRELPVSASFINCAITGSNRDEFWVIPADDEPTDLLLDHCLIRIDELLDPDNLPDFLEENTIACINRQRNDSLFADRSVYDFRPDTLSVLEGRALPITAISSDLEGNPRDPSTPDIGCFEYQY